MVRKYKHSIPLDDFLIEQLKDKDIARGFLNESLVTYIENNNFEEFLYSLELVLKSRQSISSFSREANLNRSNLYDIFRGRKKPQMHTVLKILAQLGYEIKVA